MITARPRGDCKGQVTSTWVMVTFNMNMILKLEVFPVSLSSQKRAIDGEVAEGERWPTANFLARIKGSNTSGVYEGVTRRSVRASHRQYSSGTWYGRVQVLLAVGD
jgi:Neuraminidase (sialidase)